jgi:dTDP-D-glucose 4,6-dehydratase
MTILVTGAAGFIGSNFVLDWFSQSKEDVVSLDLLTYAGNLENLSSLDFFRETFVKFSGTRNALSQVVFSVKGNFSQLIQLWFPNKF